MLKSAISTLKVKTTRKPLVTVTFEKTSLNFLIWRLDSLNRSINWGGRLERVPTVLFENVLIEKKEKFMR